MNPRRCVCVINLQEMLSENNGVMTCLCWYVVCEYECLLCGKAHQCPENNNSGQKDPRLNRRCHWRNMMLPFHSYLQSHHLYQILMQTMLSNFRRAAMHGNAFRQNSCQMHQVVPIQERNCDAWKHCSRSWRFRPHPGSSNPHRVGMSDSRREIIQVSSHLLRISFYCRHRLEKHAVSWVLTDVRLERNAEQLIQSMHILENIRRSVLTWNQRWIWNTSERIV